MRDNRDFVVPVNTLTPFVRALFSWATRHTTVCLDIGELTSTTSKEKMIMNFIFMGATSIN